jgi:hypothetical protein
MLVVPGSAMGPGTSASGAHSGQQAAHTSAQSQNPDTGSPNPQPASWATCMISPSSGPAQDVQAASDRGIGRSRLEEGGDVLKHGEVLDGL